MTNRLAWFFGGSGATGALIALGLFLWGGALDVQTSLPVWPVMMEALYMPAAALADHVWRGDLRLIHLLAALQWPSIAGVAMLVFAAAAPRSLVGRLLALGAALLVPVLPAYVFAAPVLRGRIVVWWGVWLLILAAVVGSRWLRRDQTA